MYSLLYISYHFQAKFICASVNASGLPLLLSGLGSLFNICQDNYLWLRSIRVCSTVYGEKKGAFIFWKDYILKVSGAGLTCCFCMHLHCPNTAVWKHV